MGSVTPSLVLLPTGRCAQLAMLHAISSPCNEHCCCCTLSSAAMFLQLAVANWARLCCV